MLIRKSGYVYLAVFMAIFFFACKDAIDHSMNSSGNPSGEETASEDLMDKTYDIYESYTQKNKLSQGIHESQGLIFVVVLLQFTEEDEMELEAAAMLKEQEILRAKYKLPEKYEVQRKLIENTADPDTLTYRYVTAYRKKDIEAVRDQAKKTTK